MSDELNSQLSAFVDDELTPEESELFVRRLCRDETLRSTAACYAIIGNVLRGENAVTAPRGFAPAVMMSVEGQATVPPVRTPTTGNGHGVRNWGYALAASVALAAIALVTLPSRVPDSPGSLTADRTETIAPVAADTGGAVPAVESARNLVASPAGPPTNAVASVSEPVREQVASAPAERSRNTISNAAAPVRQAVASTTGSVRDTISRTTGSAGNALVDNETSIDRAAPDTGRGVQTLSGNRVIPAGFTSSFPTTTFDGSSADYYNVPIVVPANAENRARLNNLLLQHLNSSGASRQPGLVKFRNIGIDTQVESRR